MTGEAYENVYATTCTLQIPCRIAYNWHTSAGR